ncbi:MAG: glutathione S-transferase [Legionellales bacterium]|jgi:GST-like protein|nr:glutathione S-transferase [Legionellales bacterium]|tara:strand:+ start:2185 stop:2889 length:705 start_codon:yes stop_codon:yes gene_type:complete
MKDIHLYTAPTSNGWKPIIFLEEADIEYDITAINFDKREQKEKEYLKLNPNGRIPTIVDRSNNNFVVFESGAILWYLAEKYDKFLPQNSNDKSQTLQWLMFQMANIGPMMGQAMYFQRIAAKLGEEQPFAIKRYVKESRRLMEILDKHLVDREYLVANEYTIADIATYPWARAYYWANVSIEGLPHLQAWFERIDAREATQRALEIPEPFWAFFGKGEIAEYESINAERFKCDV